MEEITLRKRPITNPVHIELQSGVSGTYMNGFNSRGSKPQPKRQDIDTRIAALKASIESECKRIGYLAANGRFDAAAKHCEYVAANRKTILELVIQREELQAMKPKDIAEPKLRKAATQTIVARKSYKRFSKK